MGMPAFSLHRMDLISGMFFGEDIPLFLARHMGIDLSCHNGTMSKQSLDISDINTLLQQERRKGMAEHMRRNMSFYSSQLAVPFNDAPNGLI